MYTKLYSAARMLICLITLLLLNNKEVSAQHKKVAALGSSTTYGMGTTTLDSSWERRFSRYYKQGIGIMDTAFNLGTSGATCYQGMPTSYTPPAGRPAPLAKNVTRALTLLNGTASSNGVVIVNYPSNGYETYSIPEIMMCLQTIHDSVVALGYSCFITTTQPRTAGIFGTPAMKIKQSSIKDSILNRFGPTYTLNFWDGMYDPADTSIKAEYSYGDNTHFNDAGHRELFNRVVAKNVFDPATAGDYRSYTSGAWTDAACWQVYDGVAWVQTYNPPSPTATKITILPGHTISVTGLVEAKNIIVNAGGAITIGVGSALSVKGDLTNNGNIASAGTISFNGTTPQNTTGNITTYNLWLDNSNGLKITGASRFVVKNALYIMSGSLATNDSLVLASDSAGTAYIQPLPAGSTITGNVMIQQYIPGGHRAYRFFGHPFSSSVSLCQIENCIDITGTDGATNGFTTTGSNAPSCFRYNPLCANSSIGFDPGWKSFTSALATAADSNLVHPYQGIRLFVRGAKGEGLHGETYTPNPATICMSGPLNQGDLSVPLRKGSDANQDYNQISNPYPSPVDIGTVAYNAWLSGNITGSAIYVWNPYLGPSGQFQAIPVTNGDPYILQSCRSFQVRASYDSATLNFTEIHKNTSPTTALKTVAATNNIKLTIFNEQQQAWDETNIFFSDLASAAEDTKYDALKLSESGEFNFYSMSSDNKHLSIDARPYSDKSIIPLGIRTTHNQNYILKADAIKLPSGKAWLHDTYLDKYVALSAGTEYPFTVTTDANSQGDTRFEITFSSPDAVKPLAGTTQFSMQPNPASGAVSIQYKLYGADKAGIRITDVSGACIYNCTLGAQQNGLVDVALDKFTPGIYMVELTDGNRRSVQKLIKE